MLIEEYYQAQLTVVLGSPCVHSYDVALGKRGSGLGLIRGEVQFVDGSLLYYRELVDLEAEPVRVMYSYHYQRSDASLIFRYDDTRHHPDLPGFPHHKHLARELNVIAAEPPELSAVLREIEDLLGTS